MKLGIGLPNTLARQVERKLMLEWARLADEAGFDILGTIDKPNYDSWDPLVTLAGVAGVTERIRLATTILQLPPRNEVLVAKQAAVVDQLLAGRLVLGVAEGNRPDDFHVLAEGFEGARGASSGRSRASGRSGRTPASPTRTTACSGLRRCSSLARGSGSARRSRRRPSARSGSATDSCSAPRGARGCDSAHRASATRSPPAGSPTRPSPASRTSRSATTRRRRSTRPHHVLRYYGQLWTEPANLIHHGPPSKIADEVAAYADVVDVLILFPEIPRLDQVELLAEHVLPTYR